MDSKCIHVMRAFTYLLTCACCGNGNHFIHLFIFPVRFHAQFYCVTRTVVIFATIYFGATTNATKKMIFRRLLSHFIIIVSRFLWHSLHSSDFIFIIISWICIQENIVDTRARLSRHSYLLVALLVTNVTDAAEKTNTKLWELSN